MKITRFKIPLFDYNVKLIKVESNKDADSVVKALKPLKLDSEDLEEYKEDVINGKYNGAYHIYNFNLKLSVLLMYQHNSEKEYLETLGHEKRHLEDRILQLYGIEDIETAGLLAGYLTKKLF